MIGIVFFSCFIATCLFGVFLYYKGKYKLAFTFVLILGILPRIWLINNPSLGNNDEKYHALVAKNFGKHVLIPTLYDNPILPYHSTDYTSNHIWLSKPPVTLWLMSASIHAFGYNVISVRLPSLLLSILSMLIMFQLGKLLFGIKTGLIAMFLMAIHGTFIELGVGEVSSDHVDVCFNLLFLAIIYYSTKHVMATKKYFIYPITIGVLFGLLFLTKWHAAFFVLPICFSLFLIHKIPLRRIITDSFLAFTSALLIIFPWLIYMYAQFPKEIIEMKDALLSPITTVIQGHAGPWYYYIDKLGKLFGEFIYIPIIIVLFQLGKQSSWQKLILLIWLTIPLIGFSVIETKRFTYILIIAPAIFLLTGYFISQYQPASFIPKWLRYVVYLGLIILPIRFSIERVDYFTDHSATYDNEKLWLNTLTIFAKERTSDNTIIFNTKKHIEIMFYSHCVAYPILPNSSTIKTLQDKGYSCFVFENGRYLPL